MKKKRALSIGICLMLAFSGANVYAADTAQEEIIEAPKSGVVVTLPEAYKSLKGTIEYTDYGDKYAVGEGTVEVLAMYYPYDTEELTSRLDEEAEAEARGDLDAALELIDAMHGVNVFRIVGLSKDCGTDNLAEWYLSALDPEKAAEQGITMTEEEIESEKENILSKKYYELGTYDGITYTLMTEDPEALKDSEPFEGYDDEHYTEFITLTENADRLVENTQLTGGVTFTIPVDLAEAGEGIHFETTDLDGNAVDSKDLFAGHPVTMINLWATWCGPCINELPELEKLNQELQQKNCQIVGIVTDAKDDKKISEAKEILAEKGVSYTNLASFEGLSELLPQNSWPTSYFVDESGCLIGDAIVGKRLEQYEEMFEELLQAK